MYMKAKVFVLLFFPKRFFHFSYCYFVYHATRLKYIHKKSHFQAIIFVYAHEILKSRQLNSRYKHKTPCSRYYQCIKTQDR